MCAILFGLWGGFVSFFVFRHVDVQWWVLFVLLILGSIAIFRLERIRLVHKFTVSIGPDGATHAIEEPTSTQIP